MSTNWVYVLEGEPKDVVIVDKDGNKRHPNLEAVKKKPRLYPSIVRRTGVGNLFYGGRLGDKAALESKGNAFTTNHTILMALGYVKGPQLEEYTKD